MSAAAPSPTFRDPAGSLRLEGLYAIRSIHATARATTLALIDSPFLKALEARGDVVRTSVEDGPDGLRLLHPRVAVPTYPWEWTPGQWLAAAQLTLQLASQAVDAGWQLKDATPLNILFVGPRPVLVDVLSFDPLEAGSPIWLPYGQYVRTFLLPLLTHRLLHWPLELTFFRRDGYEPAEVYDALGWGQRLSPAALWPITIPAILDRRKASGAAQPAPRKLAPDAAAHVLKSTLQGLAARTRKAAPVAAQSEWSGYIANLTHYTAQESEAKRAWVEAQLARTAPQRVLDIGANTGEFSGLAASTGAQVVALERDAAAAERLYQRSRAAGNVASANILTVHADLSRPTAAAGWQNSEQTALLDRLRGQFDLVLMLAVIHHLLLMEQVPLDAIVTLAAQLTTRWLVLEWVPQRDPMFQSLLRGRDALYSHLDEPALLAACAGKFRIVERNELTNGRVLFLMELVPDRASQ